MLAADGCRPVAHESRAHAGGVQVLAYLPETLAVEPLPHQAIRRALVLNAHQLPGVGPRPGTSVWRGALRGAPPGRSHSARRSPGRAGRASCSTPRSAAGRAEPPPGSAGTGRLPLRPAGAAALEKGGGGLGQKFVALLPEDSGNLNLALNQGQPVVRLAPLGHHPGIHQTGQPVDSSSAGRVRADPEWGIRPGTSAPRFGQMPVVPRVGARSPHRLLRNSA